MTKIQKGSWLAVSKGKIFLWRKRVEEKGEGEGMGGRRRAGDGKCKYEQKSTRNVPPLNQGYGNINNININNTTHIKIIEREFNGNTGNYVPSDSHTYRRRAV